MDTPLSRDRPPARAAGCPVPAGHVLAHTSGRELALEVQQIVGLDPELNIVIIGRDGTLRLTYLAAAFVEGRLRRRHIAERLVDLLGRDVPIVLDPARSFGEPTVPGGVRTEVLAERLDAGEDPSGWPRSTHFRCPTCTTPSLTYSTAATTNHRPLECRAGNDATTALVLRR